MIASIAPLPKLHTGPGTLGARTFTFEDNSTTIYPRLPNGQSCRVVIIRRQVRTNGGTVFHVVRNAGKWSYRIDYAFKKGTTRMPLRQFQDELRRMGGESCFAVMFAAA